MNLNFLSKGAARNVANEFGMDEREERQVAREVHQRLLRLPASEQTHMSQDELLRIARHCAERIR